jgi:hypothetical protein
MQGTWEKKPPGGTRGTGYGEFRYHLTGELYQGDCSNGVSLCLFVPRRRELPTPWMLMKLLPFHSSDQTDVRPTHSPRPSHTPIHHPQNIVLSASSSLSQPRTQHVVHRRTHLCCTAVAMPTHDHSITITAGTGIACCFSTGLSPPFVPAVVKRVTPSA